MFTLSAGQLRGFGTSDRLGLVSYERPRQPMFLLDNFSSGKNYREAKAAQTDEEVARFCRGSHQRVLKILSERRTVLDDLARLLSRQERVQGDELRKMLSASGPSTPALSPEGLAANLNFQNK